TLSHPERALMNRYVRIAHTLTVVYETPAARLGLIALSLIWAVLAAVARPVSADTFQFNQGGDSSNPQEWNDAANWLDLTNPALNGTLPGAADDVDLNNFMTAK